MTSDRDITWEWWSMVLAWSMKGYTRHKPVLALSLLAAGVGYYSSVPYYCNQISYTLVVQSNVLAKKWSDQKSSFILWLALENGEV